jgi:hypothetical protein
MPIAWTDNRFRVVRYVGSLAGAAIAPPVLAFVFKRARYRTARIGQWTFFGPDTLVSLVPETQAQIEAADPELLRALAQWEYKLFFDEKTFCSCSAWNCGIVHPAYIAWGAEGLATAMVYFWFHVLTYREMGRWAFSIPSNIWAADLRARDQTRAWLTQHDYPLELRDAFEPNAGLESAQDTSLS